MKRDEIRTEQVILLDSDNQCGEIERFLQRGRQAGEIDETTIEKEKLEAFWQVLGRVAGSVLEETELWPIYLDRADRLYDGRLYRQDVTLGFLSSRKGGAIVDAVIISKGSFFHSGIAVRAVPITLLGAIPESSPEIEEIIREWHPNNRIPTLCVFQTYKDMPLRCSGGLAVAPWAAATSSYLLEQEPTFVVSRVVQYINLGCEYESIQESFVGTDLPRCGPDRPPRNYLIAGYASNISEKFSSYGWAGKNYAFLRVTTKAGLHPREKEDDLCVITESRHIVIDLDDSSDPCYTFVPFVIVGNEESPLRDISDGYIPPDVVTDFMDHIWHKTNRTSFRRFPIVRLVRIRAPQSGGDIPPMQGR